jgi:hypothetical protein
MKTILFLLFYNLLVVQSFAQFDNDLGIVEPRYQEFWEYEEGGNCRDLEYTIYPSLQLREFNFNALAVNYGTQFQTNVVLQVVISGPNSFSETLTSSPIDIDSGMTVLVQIPPWTAPDWTDGLFSIDFTIMSDVEDDFPENNSSQKSFGISHLNLLGEIVPYARDSNSMDGSFTNFTADYKIGNAFYIENPASLVTIGVALAQGSVPGTAFNFELLSFPDFGYISETSLMIVPPLNQLNDIGDSNFIWAYMDGLSVSLEAGSNYVVVLNHFGAADDVVVATSGYSPDYSSFYYLGDQVTWYYTNATPMVRMGTSLPVSVQELSVDKEFSVFPNPTSNTLYLEHSGTTTTPLRAEFYDVSGRMLRSDELSGVNSNSQQVLDVSTLPLGVIMMKLQSAEKAEVHKIIRH